ncbi:hypothetical protein HZH68_003809 [Vespula germanica]|uniref:Nose resistant-to-fluoxetine protein N-terminal domain-containing protein n=1 Tax=Vespula germanica TaxID=30212 RepID=A0A834NJ78_VESGE|nr:hypothetical protein HZH68_003809 [Vespula germanica]
MAFSGVRRGSAEILEEQDGDRTICAHKSPSRFFISFNMNLAGCLVRNVRGVENNGSAWDAAMRSNFRKGTAGCGRGSPGSATSETAYSIVLQASQDHSIRDGNVVHPFSSSIVEHSQRATCVGSKFGKCPERTVTTSSAVTPSPRRWHGAMSSQVPPIGRKPPVETVSSTIEEDASTQKIGSRLLGGHQFADKSSTGFSIRKKENTIDDKDGYDDNGENQDEESKDVEDISNDDDDDDDDDDDVVVEDEEEEIQAEDDEDESAELSEADKSKDSEGNQEEVEKSKSIERKEMEREAEVKDKEEDYGTMNVLGWSFKLSAGSVSKSTTTKDTKEVKYRKDVVEDEDKEKKKSTIVKEKEDKKDIKGDVKIEGESTILLKQEKKSPKKDSGYVERETLDDSKDDDDDHDDGKDNDNEIEDKLKVSPATSKKLEKVRHADKDKVRSIEHTDSKSIEKVKIELKIPAEKVKNEVQQIVEESKKIGATKPTKTASDEDKEMKKAKSAKVTKIKIEQEKKVKKSGSIEPVKYEESDEDKKAKKAETVKLTKTEPGSSKASLKSEEKRKAPAKTETPKATTKSKDEVEKSVKRKVKRAVPETARNETKSKTKEHRDATKNLADLNDKILRVPSFVPNFTAVEDTNCQQHGKIFLRQLRGYKLWALQMLDSNAKIPSSLLRGNVNQFGDFDQCLGITSHVKMGNNTIKIQGKYCLATIDLYATQQDMKLPVHLMQARTFIKGNMHDPGHFIPRFTTINWALCLPAACTAKDAEISLIDALSYYNSTSGIRFTVDVNPDMCYIKQRSRNYSKETIGVLYFYAAVVCLVIIATIRDYLVMSEGKGNYSERIIMAFSLRRTVKYLFKEIKSNSKDIACLHGLRSVFMIIIYFAHRIIPLSRIPYANRVVFTEFANNPISCLLRVSSLYTDSFLLLSGLLTAYNMVKELTSRGEIRWFCRFIVRFIRLTPALIVIIFWYAFVMEHIGSGPLWNNIIVDNAELCKKNAWTNLLYIQNFFPFEEMCATHTHQLALDMQLSLLAPILVFFLHYKPIIGIILLFFLIQVSATLRYIATINNNLSIVIFHGMSLKQLYKVANLSYILALHRATPYACGVGLGVLLHYTGKSVKIPKVFVILGWLIAMSFGTWSLFSPWRTAKRDYVYDVEEATHYTVISPVSWAIALCWTIFACFTDHGGIINRFLSNYWFVIFSRISYAIYLTQFPVFFYNVGTTRYTTEFQEHRMIDFLEIFVVICVSIVVTLLFDLPMQEVRNVIMESTDSLSTDVPIEKLGTDETNETKSKESVKKIVNGAKIFEDDEATSAGWDWQKNVIEADIELRNESIKDEGIANIPGLKKSEERRKSFIGYDDGEKHIERGRINRRIPYSFDSEEETMEYFRNQKEEETRRNRRSVSRTKEIKRSMPIEIEDDYIRRRSEEGYSNQYRRSESKERSSVREHDDYRSWEFINKERSTSIGPDSMRFLTESEEYVPRSSRRSVAKSMDSRRTFSSGSEDEPPVQRRSKHDRRYPSVEPKVSDEEEWEEELRIRRRRYMEKLASQQSDSAEEEDITSLRRRSSAEGRIALLKDPSGNENMDAWTVSVGPRIAQLGSSQEPSEPEDDASYLQRREYREKAPPFRENPYSEEKDSSVRDDKDVASFNFVLTKDSKRKSVQDLTKLDDSDLTESGWSLVKEEGIEILPKSSLGLYKRESIIKSQASEEDPEYYLPERPKLVQQEQEHPFKKAWQMQKSRSEEDALAYIVKDKKLVQSETKKDDDASTSKIDTTGEKSQDFEDLVTEETDKLSVWHDRSTDTEDNQQSSKSEIESDIESTSVRQSSNTDVDESGPCSVSETDSDTSRFVWPTEDEQFEMYKTGPRRKSMETNCDWEEEET